MFRQVCIIEPSFFNTTSGMHRRPFEARQLVLLFFLAQFYLTLVLKICQNLCILNTFYVFSKFTYPKYLNVRLSFIQVYRMRSSCIFQMNTLVTACYLFYICKEALNCLIIIVLLVCRKILSVALVTTAQLATLVPWCPNWTPWRGPSLSGTTLSRESAPQCSCPPLLPPPPPPSSHQPHQRQQHSWWPATTTPFTITPLWASSHPPTWWKEAVWRTSLRRPPHQPPPGKTGERATSSRPPREMRPRMVKWAAVGPFLSSRATSTKNPTRPSTKTGRKNTWLCATTGN